MVPITMMFHAYMVVLLAEKRCADRLTDRLTDRQTDGHLHFLSCFLSQLKRSAEVKYIYCALCTYTVPLMCIKIGGLPS